MQVTDFNGNSILLENGKPIIKPNPDYHSNIISCIEPQIEDKLILQTALEEEIIELKYEIKRLNLLNEYNKIKQLKKSKKCNIL